MRKLLFSIMFSLLFISGTINAQWTDIESGYDSPWIFFDNSFPAGQNDIGFIGGMHTTYNGDGVILKTDDAGATWSTNLGGSDGSLFGIEAIFFTSTDVGFAAGWDDDIKYTIDGGATWTDLTVGTGIFYYTDIEFWDANNGVISASLNSGSHQVWVTGDGGSSWTAATGVSIGIVDLAYADATTLFAVGSEEDILKSTDGGSTWSLNYDGSDPDNDPLLGVNFYNANFGVVGGMDGKVLVTTNGGSSWSTNQIAGSYPSFYAIHCFNADSIYVGGTDKIIYRSTDGGTTWSSMNGGGGSSLYQFAFTANNTGFVTGSSGTILTIEAPLTANFSANPLTTCTGGSVVFTDNSSGAISWAWAFEGGTPSTSTDQNPAVTYNTAGTFDVSLTVSDGSNYQTENKYEYIVVLETPAKADQPNGDTETCTGNTYYYEINSLDYATAYEWEIAPADAGTIIWEDNFATFEADDTWIGDFTLKARATNMCGDGEWSDELQCTLSTSPDDFNLEGGGSYCLGGDGVEITLDGSQTDINYELYLDGTATGNVVAGTGSELSFGLLTDEGYYEVLGSNDDCTTSMTGQVQVIVEYPPLEPANPTGPVVVCNDEISDYETTGTDDADSYNWTLNPEEAGTLTANGMEASVVWNSGFSGTANVAVYGINDCGDGNPSEELEVSVQAIPAPEVSGEDLVCDFHVEDYAVEDHEGSTFTWAVGGGTIAAGQGTYLITVEWGEPGTGYVEVNEETSNGCSGDSEQFDVLVDDCTGIGEGALLNDVSVYPNPARNNVNISLNIENGVSYTITVYNTIGRMMYSSNETGTSTQQKHTFQISSFPEGLYIISVQSKDASLWRGKFEKSK